MSVRGFSCFTCKRDINMSRQHLPRSSAEVELHMFRICSVIRLWTKQEQIRHGDILREKKKQKLLKDSQMVLKQRLRDLERSNQALVYPKFVDHKTKHSIPQLMRVLSNNSPENIFEHKKAVRDMAQIVKRWVNEINNLPPSVAKISRVKKEENRVLSCIKQNRNKIKHIKETLYNRFYKCAQPNCDGGFSEGGSCCVCGNITCVKCHTLVPLGTSHTCDHNNITTLQRLQQACTQCPNCLTYINKVEDTCNDMYCTLCQTSFVYVANAPGKTQRSKENRERTERIRSEMANGATRIQAERICDTIKLDKKNCLSQITGAKFMKINSRFQNNLATLWLERLNDVQIHEDAAKYLHYLIQACIFITRAPVHVLTVPLLQAVQRDTKGRDRPNKLACRWLHNFYWDIQLSRLQKQMYDLLVGIDNAEKMKSATQKIIRLIWECNEATAQMIQKNQRSCIFVDHEKLTLKRIDGRKKFKSMLAQQKTCLTPTL